VFGSGPWPQPFATRLARHFATLRQGGMAALLAS
jgi:fructuronate reductase